MFLKLIFLLSKMSLMLLISPSRKNKTNRTWFSSSIKTKKSNQHNNCIVLLYCIKIFFLKKIQVLILAALCFIAFLPLIDNYQVFPLNV